MHSVLIVAVIVLVLAAIVAAAYKNLPQAKSDSVKLTKTNHKFRKNDALFTAAEQQFLAALDAAVQGSYRVFGQVRVADVLEPRAAGNTSNWWSGFGKIKSKSFDFVLCDPASLANVAAIELDDSSHARPDRSGRDQELDEFCQSADLPLIHFRVRAKYDVAAIRGELQARLGPDSVCASRTAKRPCPNCGHALDRLEGRDGAFAGRPIWRCSQYPDCRTVIPVQT